eukprot:c4217_g1_i1.p1 GENE.c4217_g1_i1~~c4217_g1_i1.p1  ORF type:complete len:135 (+),score=39.23 c4217_g1_i1:55-459(+)
MFLRSHASPVCSRIRLVQCDFLRDDPPQPHCDFFALACVLQRLNDDSATSFLRRLLRCLPPEGGLLIQEKIRGECCIDAELQNVDMLLRESGMIRSLDEMTQLLTGAGYFNVKLVRLPFPVDVVVAFASSRRDT